MSGQGSFTEKLRVPQDVSGLEPQVASAPHCPSCGSSALRRNARDGFFENRVFCLFGYYPWECADCRKKTYLRRRYKSGRRTREYSK